MLQTAVGGDAPYQAWKFVRDELGQAGHSINLEHEFWSEDPQAPHAARFLMQNYPEAKRGFSDMHARTRTGGPCFPPEGFGVRWGVVADLPAPFNLDCYWFGSESNDISGMNRNPRDIVVEWEVMADTNSGRSTRTLMKSLHTVKSLMPRTFGIENTKDFPVVDVIVFIQREIPGYWLGALRLNAADYGMCGERDRWYIIGGRITRRGHALSANRLPAASAATPNSSSCTCARDRCSSG